MKIQTGPGQKKILLADDLLLTRISIARLLQHFSLDTICVGTGESALAHLNDQANGHFFDLCIFDISLPDINGLQLMRIVREISPGTPVIIITGKSMDHSTQAAIDAASACLISKPFEVSCFVDRVLDILHAPRASFASCISRPSPMVGEGKRVSARKSLRQTIDFKYSHFALKGEAAVGRVVLKKDIQGDTINISNEGIGLRTAVPLKKNHAVIFPGSIGRTGVIKWCSQMRDDTYHVGLKFV